MNLSTQLATQEICTQAVFQEEDSMSSQANKANPWGSAVSCEPTQYPNHDLYDNDIYIGRNPNKCQIVLDKPQISGIHCKIIRDETTKILFVEDFSTNGTYLDSGKLGKGNKLLIHSGSEIVLIPQSKQKNRDKISYTIYTEGDNARGEKKEGIFEKYELGKILGSGTFATVKLCINRKTGDKFACKIIDKTKFKLSNFRPNATMMDEVKILQKLNHDGIVSVYDVYNTDQYLYIVLELVNGGELFDEIVAKGRFSEERSRKIFIQILNAVDYLHSNNIVHRDLKPENILLKQKDSDIIKISDFGLSRIVGEGSFMQTQCGTPEYLAPEVLRQGSKVNYTKAVDVWSIGVILYILLSGVAPFSQDTIYGGNINDQITTGNYNFPDEYWKDVSHSAIDLIKKLLSINPQQRYTIQQALNHDWVDITKNSNTGTTGNTLRNKRKRNLELPQEYYIISPKKTRMKS